MEPKPKRRRRMRRVSRETGVTIAQQLREARLRCELQACVIELSKIELRRARNLVRRLEHTRGK